MELETGEKEIIIKPDRHLATTLVNEIIYSKGVAYLNDSLRENLSELSSENPYVRFKFGGLYPHEFKDHDEARRAKEELTILIDNTNKATRQFQIKNIDDILFITYFYYGHVGKVRSSQNNVPYLEELIDVFLSMMTKKLTPTPEDYLWIPDGSTGIETEVNKNEFTEKEVLMNGGFKTVSRMVGANNIKLHLPGDFPVVVQGRSESETEIQLPSKLSAKINSFIVDQILVEHRRADTDFYKEVCSGYIDASKWSNRDRKKKYKRTNKVLFHLIERIDGYLISTNKFVLTKRERHVFIYDLFKILKLIESPFKINVTDKSSAIRTICRDNEPCGGNSIS